MLSTAKQVDVPEHLRASVRHYNRDDVWEALACEQLVVQKVA